ncbi:HEAT repeat domain-containing protein [Halococcus saccharolyticus]|uniref:Protein phosphatase n=1 Tax=Halococcus saccharolyticus DSM 5350 TaxID=1227455 RepID=M0MK76_9EURY|nr:HEAT repeat domain-containing protein [Halococcus saccharolyticus]EMA46051.1 protein phosphatase [Halococcus saccharolyticus DSM 5350]
MSHNHDHDHDCGCDSGCGCESNPYSDDPEYEEIEEEPDPQLDPRKSPGFDHTLDSLADIEVGRDVTLGEMTPDELTASDTDPVADASARELLADLEDGSKTERRRATLALAETDGSAAVVSALSQVALGDDDSDVRQFAIESLAKLRADDAGDVALAISHDDEDPWVRAEALVALDRIDREGYAERMEAALTDDHHAARRNALISLFKVRGEDIEDDAIEMATDPSERVREWAAHVLGGIDDDRARRTLEGMATSDDSDIVALTARHARSVDPARFRRRFTGAMEEGDTLLPGEDLLNRQPTL